MSGSLQLPYRDGVGILLLSRDNLVFVAKRIDTMSFASENVGELPPHPLASRRALRGDTQIDKRFGYASEAWQMPQGGIDAGETPLEAAMREMQEEIGTGKAALLAESRDWLTYDLPEPLAGRIWNGKYRGQRQKWFAMRFTGEDGDINIATPEPEFCEWRWVAMERLPEMIVPFKKPLYRALVEEFRHLAG